MLALVQVKMQVVALQNSFTLAAFTLGDSHLRSSSTSSLMGAGGEGGGGPDTSRMPNKGHC